MSYVPCMERPWMIAPTTEIAEPKKIDQRRPNLWLNVGMKGNAQIAPRE